MRVNLRRLLRLGSNAALLAAVVLHCMAWLVVGASWYLLVAAYAVIVLPLASGVLAGPGKRWMRGGVLFTAGFAVILLQRLSWWEYQYLLLSVPVGILATKGIEILWVSLEARPPFRAPGKVRFAGAVVRAHRLPD